MSNGETLFPVYYTEVYDGFGGFAEFGAEGFWKGTRHMCGVVVTDDMGESYKPFGNIAVDLNNYPKEVGSPHMWEPNCIDGKDVDRCVSLGAIRIFENKQRLNL